MAILEIINFYNQIGEKIITWYISINRPILDFIHITSDKVFNAILLLTIFLSIFFMTISMMAIMTKKKKNEYVFIKEKAQFVTIQIPTYNELAALNCAKKCLAMDYPKDKFEIIIGDDSNNPEISKQIDEFAKKYEKITITRRGNNEGYKPGNLNHMLKYTKGDIIVIFDSDFLPDKKFLKKIVAPFQHDENIGGVQARWEITNAKQNKTSLLGGIIVLGFHHVYLPFMKKIGNISFLCGSAEAVRKDLLIERGGWTSGSLTEDIEYSIRLINDGYRIHYLEDYSCGGEAPYKKKDLYKQQMRWAYGVTKSIITHAPKFTKNKNLPAKTKFLIYFQGIGYFFSFLILALFVTGTISFLSHAPAPINIPEFMTDMAKNILLSSGILIATIVGLYKSGLEKKTFKALAASFTIGLVVVMYVNIGVYKAITKKPMKWFMLSKVGNQKKQS